MEEKKITTKKIYEEDAYAAVFTAKVLSCAPLAKGRYALILDRTAFFPEAGGQSCDKGWLYETASERAAVLDVQIQDSAIIHTVDRSFAKGARLTGELDFPRRFSNMQQHSGEHLFSGIAHTRFGCKNVGFHLSDSEVTLDLDRALTAAQIQEIEETVNEAIYRNIASRVHYPTKEEEEAMTYRSKMDIAGQVRIVEYPGIDRCACCAPHLRRTGEIGLLKVVSYQSYKGGVRISILCGGRAFALLSKEHKLLRDLAERESASYLDIPALYEKLKAENAHLARKLSARDAEKLAQLMEAVPLKQENVCLFVPRADRKAMQKCVNDLTGRHTGYCAVFAGEEEEGYRYVLGIREGDARLFAARLAERFGAKGGGSAAMVQGSLSAARKEIEEMF